MSLYGRAAQLFASSLLVLILALIPVSAFAMGKGGGTGGSGGTGGTGGSGGTGGTGGGAGVDHDVVIIGAGSAGLYAAFELDNLGFDVLVLEAQNRHGGRVEKKLLGGEFIEAHAEGVTGDKNANWHATDINALDKNRLVPIFTEEADDNLLLSIAGSTILGTDVTKRGNPEIYDYWDFYYSGADYTGPDIDAETYICDTLGVCRGDDTYHLYDSSYPGGEFATSPGRLGMRSLAEQESAWDLGVGEWGFTNSTWIDTLDELYFNAILSNVQLNSPVTAVDTSGSNAVVTYGAGSTVTANAVIVTVPTGVLRAGDIAFTPALSASKQNALGTIGDGTGGKMFLQFSSQVWAAGTGSFFTEGEAGYCWTYEYKDGTAGDNLLVCFVMGENAEFMASLPTDTQRFNSALSDLDALYAGTPFSDGFVTGFWEHGDDEQYLKGVYSYPKIGSYPTDGSPSARQVLAAPVGAALYFAGEATSHSYAATVFGALNSGLRAAGEVDADHNPQ